MRFRQIANTKFLPVFIEASIYQVKNISVIAKSWFKSKLLTIFKITSLKRLKVTMVLYIFSNDC